MAYPESHAPVDPDENVDYDNLPEDLPPVEPPSAGFIVQLFVVPAIIVAAIIGLYLLFGQMADNRQDWREQLVDLRSENPHIRWRGALGLAQMLEADAAAHADGEQLSQNREVAQELADLLAESLRSGSSSADRVNQQVFLARTLGWMDVPDVVLPPLTVAMGPTEDIDVRRAAISAVAMIGGRATERGKPLQDADLTEALIAVSRSDSPALRQLAAYTLGLVESDRSFERLLVLLEDGNAEVRANAAVALARLGSTEGLPVFREVLTDSSRSGAYESIVAIRNVLRATVELAPQFTQTERAALLELIEPIAEAHPESKLRIEAREAIHALEERKGDPAGHVIRPDTDRAPRPTIAEH